MIVYNNVNMKKPTINAKLKESTDAFEAIYVKKMLDIAYKNSNIGGTGPGKEIIKSMYLDAISKSGEGSIGISKLLYDNLLRNKK